MKKRSQISFILIFLSVFSIAADSYPPEGWTSDLLEALAESEKKEREVLLYFTGSDWVHFSRSLWDEVLGTKQFKRFAKKNLVLVILDSPHYFDLPEEVVTQNELMIKTFGVEGFPTIWLLDSEQVPLMKTGYREVDAKEYIRHLTEDRTELDEASKIKTRDFIRREITDNLGPW